MRSFNRQVFISFNLLFTFTVMTVSGIILYFKPEGSIARWLGWEIWGLTKSGWEALHTVFSFLFLVFVILHIVKIHLGLIRLYFLNRKTKGTFREMSIALIISVVFLTGTVFSIPPFHLIFKAGNYLSDSWNNQVEIKHEAYKDLTLEEMGIILDVQPSKVVKITKNIYDIENISEKTTIAYIAHKTKGEPSDIKEAIIAQAGHLLSFPDSE